MKKFTTVFAALFITCASFGQEKKDIQSKDSVVIIQITLSVDDYKEFVKLVETNVDSKKETIKIYAILDKGFRVFKQPADKPKQPKQ